MVMSQALQLGLALNFRQIVRISKGTNCDPLFGAIFL